MARAILVFVAHLVALAGGVVALAAVAMLAAADNLDRGFAIGLLVWLAAIAVIALDDASLWLARLRRPHRTATASLMSGALSPNEARDLHRPRRTPQDE